MSNESSKISRRDFMKVSARYGMTSTLLAAGTLGAGATLSQLANAAAETDAKRYAVEPKFKLKFGASGFNEKNLNIQKSGQLFFATRCLFDVREFSLGISGNCDRRRHRRAGCCATGCVYPDYPECNRVGLPELKAEECYYENIY